MLTVLDLFSGIGGFSLGLERTGGFRTVAFCEIDPYCRRVLAKHWPGVPIHEDVRKLKGADVGAVDAICGGFPCQDISTAGKGAGLAGERSGLWSEYARLVGELRPRFVLVENVAALLGRGLGTVLGDLASLGYDAEWHCIPASAVGAPHRRDRVWIVAYTHCDRFQEREYVCGTGGEKGAGQQSRGPVIRISPSQNAANPKRGQQALGRPFGRMGGLYQSIQKNRDWPITHQPTLDRGVDGVPARLDRLRALGNAVVPQIPEMIGRAILAAETA